MGYFILVVKERVEGTSSSKARKRSAEKARQRQPAKRNIRRKILQEPEEGSSESQPPSQVIHS